MTGAIASTLPSAIAGNGASLAGSAGSSGSGSGDLFTGILLAMLVCVLAWLATRFLSGHLAGTGFQSGVGFLSGVGFQSGAGFLSGGGFLSGIGKGLFRKAGSPPGQPRWPGQARRPGQLQVVERLNLGKERQILVLRIGNELYLAGVTASGIEFGPPVSFDLEAALSAASAGKPAAPAHMSHEPAPAPESPAAAPDEAAAARPPRFESILAALLQSDSRSRK